MRDLGKDLRNLQLALLEQNDKPIYYISKIYGDKYIVPKKEYEKAIDKLGKYEDLQEELGCPLDIVLRALKQNYIYTQGINVYGNYDKRFIFNKREYIHLTYKPAIESFVIEHMEFGFYTYPVKLQDYKKTWWLKEDKSE